jgi:DNA polymerase (family X)
VPRTNDAVESMLLEFAELLAIVSSDAFKSRAYEKAAKAVGGYSADVDGMDLSQILGIPSIGKSIGTKILEFLENGSVPELEDLRAQVPAGIRELTRIPGMGPKKAVALHQELGVASVDDLRAAIDADAIARLKGFGPKTQENLRRGLEQVGSSGGRAQIDGALELAESLLDDLRTIQGVARAAYAGSLRRMCETIGDVDLLIASVDPAPVMDAFTSRADVARVLAKGPSKSSIVTRKDLQIDLRVVDPAVWGAAMIYFTGSKAHNVRIRELAVRRGMKLNEYGLFDAKTGELFASEAEEDVYAALDMPFIPPTLREDRGEVEAALAGELPELVELRHIKGDLHAHTDLTDGVGSLEQMVAGASEKGYRYFAVTDHAPNLWMQRMTDEKMLAQREALDRLRSTFPKLELLHGTELNIDPDGGVDWDERFLSGFDVTVASVHSHFSLSREEQTRRVIRAIEHPSVNVIGHLTTRKIDRRPPIDLDLEAVFAAAAATGTAIEINAHPDRLDLKDDHILWARRHGVRFAVDTDSHAVPHLDLMRFGVAMAQRGWLSKEDVINTWPVTRLRRFLRKGR